MTHSSSHLLPGSREKMKVRGKFEREIIVQWTLSYWQWAPSWTELALAQCHEVLVYTVHHSYTWCALLWSIDFPMHPLDVTTSISGCTNLSYTAMGLHVCSVCSTCMCMQSPNEFYYSRRSSDNASTATFNCSFVTHSSCWYTWVPHVESPSLFTCTRWKESKIEGWYCNSDIEQLLLTFWNEYLWSENDCFFYWQQSLWIKSVDLHVHAVTENSAT